jgi:hypothetical protein
MPLAVTKPVFGALVFAGSGEASAHVALMQSIARTTAAYLTNATLVRPNEYSAKFRFFTKNFRLIRLLSIPGALTERRDGYREYNSTINCSLTIG